jgi:hypothetical protein
VATLPGNDRPQSALARPETALDRALARLGTALAAKEGIEGESGAVEAI